MGGNATDSNNTGGAGGVYRFGICEWTLPACGAAAVELAGLAGFEGIQLGDLGGSAKGYPLCDRRVQTEILEASAHTGVELQALHLHTLVREGGMIHPAGTQEGQSAMESIRRGVESCRALGIPVLMLTSGFACEIRDEEGFFAFSRMLNYACDIADDSGVRIVFESILGVPDILRMRRATGGRMRICYDTFNMIRFGRGNPLEDLARLESDDIDHFHLKDAPPDLKGCALLGRGCGCFDEVARRICETGFSGWLVSENYYAQPPLCEGGDPVKLARLDAEMMRASFRN
ncbi:MAG: sugar phosphate isomerase/epimerase family protein [Rectinemataceae bacterium]|nr:sugar phosphate isomerase/epimerase family protein [Rectinemataceae bacterium]